MATYRVQIVESRDLLYEVEADDESEAFSIANDMDVTEAISDSFRSRELDWVELTLNNKPPAAL